MAGFKPQANLPFVAVYVAQERGYFRAQGLEVAIEHATQSENVRLLAAGRIQFSTADAANVVKWSSDEDLPIVSVALFGQRGQQAFAVRSDSGIASPKDWEGRLVGYKGTPSADYLAILKAAGVDRGKVREVPVGFDPRVFAERRVDVYPLFKSNEPDILARLGVALRLFDAAAYGVPTLGLALVTSRDMIDRSPDVVRRFVRASLRGLADAVADREAAVDAVMKYAPGEDRAHQRFMLDAEIADAESELTRANGLAWQSADQWSAMERSLLDVGAIARPVGAARVETDAFLRDSYRDGRLTWP
jgi:ABC-type nitrate/sulfonate/bicarbonate transport system substrate-binding protein